MVDQLAYYLTRESLLEDEDVLKISISWTLKKFNEKMLADIPCWLFQNSRKSFISAFENHPTNQPTCHQELCQKINL